MIYKSGQKGDCSLGENDVMFKYLHSTRPHVVKGGRQQGMWGCHVSVVGHVSDIHISGKAKISSEHQLFGVD